MSILTFFARFSLKNRKSISDFKANAKNQKILSALTQRGSNTYMERNTI